MSHAADNHGPADPTVYPVEEKMGEDILQRWMMELLRPLLADWLAEQGILALVGADQFIYFKQHDPHQRVAPDIYVLPGVEPTRHISSWKTWEEGLAPSFALEIVSKDWEKDYADVVPRYNALGVAELVIFDPNPKPKVGRVRWQVFRRVARRGLTRVEVTMADRVYSKALNVWFRSVGSGPSERIRIASAPNGDVLVPTPHEIAQQTAIALEQERQAKEQERQAKEQALIRVAALEAELNKRSQR